MYVLDARCSVLSVAAVAQSFSGGRSCLFVAVLAEALLHGGDVDDVATTKSWSTQFACGAACRDRGSSFRLLPQAAFVQPEWAPGGLVWLILPKDLARTALVLLEDRVSILWILNRSPPSRCVSGCASLLQRAWVSVDPTYELIRDHHEA